MEASQFQHDGHFWSGRASFSFLGDLAIAIIPEGVQRSPSQLQLAVADWALALTPTFQSALNAAALNYCTEICEYVDLEEELGLALITDANISNHFRITDMVIPRLNSCKRKYFFLAGECDWDPDHGIELLIENDSILRCGQQNCLYLNAEWSDFISVNT